MSTFVVKLLQRTQLSHSQLDVKPFIYARSNWLDNEAEFDFLSTVDNRNYRGSIKYEELRTAATELEQPFETFFEECKGAMTTHMGQQGFDYELCLDNAEEPVFKMYKCMGYETLYLEIALRTVSNCYQLLDAAIEAGQQRPTPAAPVVTESQNQETASLAEYEQYVKDSKQKEEELLKKFLLLINSKKAHIRDLESQLEEERSKKSSNSHKISSDEEEDEAYGAATQAMNVGDEDS
ncbi:uncharacterized protein [Drosophila kikkawai]|uniref:XRCC4 N-terminal domain-containing protein n=1 Tax=Drosophila kikkawai TaxID=30033 RepID=A0A6P4IHX0_DROKI|nr:uncharacterized protein LOC108078913 [Drosophila kikkawai]